MSMHEYVVRQQDGLWEVWHGDRLVSGHPTYEQALNIAETLVYAASARGERAKILLGASSVDRSGYPGEPSRRRA